MADIYPEYPAQTGQVVADPRKPFKAIAAAVIAFIGLLWANLAGRDDFANMTVAEWVTIIVPTVITFGGTYLAPNPVTVIED